MCAEYDLDAFGGVDAVKHNAELGKYVKEKLLAAATAWSNPE